MTLSAINRLQKEIAALQKDDGRKAAEEAHLVGKINRAESDAAKTKSVSTARSKLRDVERHLKSLATIRKKRGELSSKIATKSKKLGEYQTKQLKADQNAQKKLADQQQALTCERDTFQRKLFSDIRQSIEAPDVQYDFFVSHASEDKESFVRHLAEALRARKAQVWYDEFTLKVGDSLRQSIDRGLASSRFGIVVLSEHFFQKEWTARELNGLVTLEIKGQTRILPILHKVSMDEVAKHTPTIADKFALNTGVDNIDAIAQKLCDLL